MPLRRMLLASAVLSAAVAGCTPRAIVPTSDLHSAIGQTVTLVGVAEARKLGAALKGDGFEVWIDGLEDWPADQRGQRVQVVGILEERDDLPVFIADTADERAKQQGIPVPTGTDVREASRRYVVRAATTTVVR